MNDNSAMVVLCSVPSIETSAEQKAEYKSCVQYSVSHLCGTLRGLIMYSGSSDVRVQALLAVKQVLIVHLLLCQCDISA